MSDSSRQARLSESEKLLALAEDVIIGLRSGVETPSTRQEGVQGREKDKAGLRAMLHGKDALVDLGREVWYETTSPSFLARIAPAVTTSTSTQSSLPAELLHEIISLSDKDSLLNLCLASNVLREIASPLLYKKLKFESPHQLEAFSFPPASPRFAKQRPTVTLNRTIDSHLYCHRPYPYSMPLPPFGPLPLPAVRQIHFHSFTRAEATRLSDCLLSFQSLIAPLDPLSISFATGPDDPLKLHAATIPLDLWNSISAGWRSLQVVKLRSFRVHVWCKKQRRDLRWDKLRPRAPHLELEITKPDISDLEGFQHASALDRLIDTFLFDDIPLSSVFTIRLPSEEDRLRFEEMSERSGFSKDNRPFNFVTGRRRLEELE